MEALGVDISLTISTLWTRLQSGLPSHTNQLVWKSWLFDINKT